MAVSRVSVRQVLRKALAEQDAENLEVWQLDASQGEASLCRVFVRRGLCKYGARCRHRHDLDLSSAALRAQRGAAMPNLVKRNSRVRFGSGDAVAFVLCEGRAIFDYEDPMVAQRYIASVADGLQGRDLWTALPAEVAVATLCSAGLSSACAALRSCKDWNEEAISRGCRERAYKETAGAEFRGCSASQLGEFLLIRRLLLSTLSQFSAKGPAEKCSPVVQTLQPSPVAVLLVDGSVIFAILRSGEVRCHRCSTGQLLASSLARLGKGRFATAAALLGSEAFILGDDLGGLLWLCRDDLSETQSLRASNRAAVASLTPLRSPEDCLCLSADGGIELIHVTDSSGGDTPVQARISHLGCVGVQPPLRPSGSNGISTEDGLTPTLCMSADDVALVVGPHEVWTVSGASLLGPVRAKTPCATLAAGTPGLCHGVCMDGLAVTASSTSSQLQWWTLSGAEVTADVVTTSTSSGGVLALKSHGDLCASLHAYLCVVLWQGALRQEVLKVSLPGLGHALALAADVVAVASAPVANGFGRGKVAANALHLATLPLVVESIVKEPKKPKPAKMFAQKTRGGRKNQKSKQQRQV